MCGGTGDVRGARLVRADGPRRSLAFPASAVAEAYPLVDLSVREPDIESVIAKMYGESHGGTRERRQESLK